jgi:predicted benzoate:H+ symporter BenE
VETIKIIVLAVAAAIVYGILHDQITARVCVEYFTIGHAPVFHTEDPTLLGLGWGVIATWWVGLPLGLVLAAAARVGSLPKMDARDLLKPVGVMMACCGVLALAAGVVGYVLANVGAVSLDDGLAARIPPARHALFLADGFAHQASYTGGFVGGFILCIWVVMRRYRRQGIEALKDHIERLEQSAPENGSGPVQ